MPNNADQQTAPAMTRLEIQERLKTNGAQGTLTLISMTLAASLAILAQRWIDGVEIPQYSSISKAHASMQLVATVAVIFGTFYFYNYSVAFTHTRPRLLPVFLQFLVGGSTIFLVGSIGRDQFHGLTAVFFLFASLAFLITWHSTDNASFSDADDIKKMVVSDAKKNFYYFLLMLAVTVTFWIIDCLDLLQDEFFEIPLYVMLLYSIVGTIFLYCVVQTERKLLRNI